MAPSRTMTLLAAVALAGTLTACGSSSSSSTTTRPPSATTTSTTTGTTTSTTGVPGTSTSSTAAASGPVNVVATAADKAALTAAYAAYKQVDPSEIEGTSPGSVYLATDPSTGTYWALASFLPSATASQQTEVGMQDGGETGIFTRTAGGSWTMVSLGSEPFCPSKTPIPPAVAALWGLTDPPECSA